MEIHSATDPSVDEFPAQHGIWRLIDVIGLGVIACIALICRFWTTSPMWLDEALTVHIAQQPLSQIPLALRHDGHPPLYYVMLHGWMQLFGTSNMAIRSLSGCFGVAAIPATYFVARRLGNRNIAWCAAVFVALMPFAVRYSTENRMYAMIMLFVPVAWLCADQLLRRPDLKVAIGLVVCTSALLWSQYWALWLGATAASCSIIGAIRAARNGDQSRRNGYVWIIGSLAAGAVTFLPWIPTLLYQQAHTGTPWGARSMPQSALVMTVEGIGGPTNSTGQVGSWILCLIVLLGVFGMGVRSGKIELDLRTQKNIRGILILAVGTFAFGIAVSFVTNAAFQARYNAVWLPFVFVIAGFGLATFRGPLLQRGALVVLLLASSYGLEQNVKAPRSQAQVIAQAIVRHGRPGDIVAVCPDQLGPALMRVLPDRFSVGSFPRFSDPHTVDWVDYVKRNNAVTPQQFASNLLNRAGQSKQIFVVWSDKYTTHKVLCPELVEDLARARPQSTQLVKGFTRYFENANLNVFLPDRK